LNAWQQARHTARTDRRTTASDQHFIDLLADSLAALFRVMLRRAAGRLHHGEVADVFAAVVVAAAPAVLAQVGRATTVAEALQTGAVTEARAAPLPPSRHSGT
jgi:hypothetical protein